MSMYLPVCHWPHHSLSYSRPSVSSHLSSHLHCFGFGFFHNRVKKMEELFLMSWFIVGKRKKGSRGLHVSCPWSALLTYSTFLASKLSICVYLLWSCQVSDMLAFRIFSGCHPLLEKLDVRGGNNGHYLSSHLYCFPNSILLIINWKLFLLFFLIASKCKWRVIQRSREYSTYLSFL